MKKAKRLFLTTLLVTAANFGARTASVWFAVLLGAGVGSAGIGLWNLILSVYFFAKTLSGAGLGLATLKAAIEEPGSTAKNLRRMYLFALIQGGAAGALLFLFSGAAVSFVSSPAAAPALKILSLSLPFSAVNVCTGGYCAARRKMARCAITGLGEQCVKIGFGIASLRRFSDPERVMLGAAAGITAGEVFSLICGLAGVLADRIRDKEAPSVPFRRRMVSVALPDAAGSVLRSVLSTVQNLLIPAGMMKSGATAQRSLSAYGAVHGMALPVVLYPSGILAALSGLLIPEFAGTESRREISYMTSRVLRFSLLFSLLCACAAGAFSGELSLAVFGSEEAAPWIRLLAPLIPVMYLDMASDGILKGLGLQKKIMAINVLDSAASVALIYFLVPKMGIYGYVFMVGATEVMNFALSYRLMKKNVPPGTPGLGAYLKTVPVAVAAAAASRILTANLYLSSSGITVSLKIAICVALCVLFWTAAGHLTKDDARWIKGLIK